MYKILKNIMDKTLALGGILILSPLFLILIVAIKLESEGPAIFKQERTGLYEKPFKMYKFRTMKSTEVLFDINNPVIKNDNINLTKVGKFIRRFKIDELLQLFNVLKGDMSLIGPRPLMLVYLGTYDTWEKQKFKVKPGMSGLSQVRGNGHLSSKERSYYDVYYANHYNFKLDTEIFLKTIAVILFGEEKYICHVDDFSVIDAKYE